MTRLQAVLNMITAILRSWNAETKKDVFTSMFYISVIVCLTAALTLTVDDLFQIIALLIGADHSGAPATHHP